MVTQGDQIAQQNLDIYLISLGLCDDTWWYRGDGMINGDLVRCQGHLHAIGVRLLHAIFQSTGNFYFNLKS